MGLPPGMRKALSSAGACSNCFNARAAPGRKLCLRCLEKASSKMRRRKEAGQCYECASPVETGHTRCRRCLDARAADRRSKNESRTAAGLCYACGEPAEAAVAAGKCARHFFAAAAALVTYRGRGHRITGAELEAAWRRQNGLCNYTRLPMMLGGGNNQALTASVDHVISLETGGDNSATNLQWVACLANSMKGRLTDTEFRYILGPAGLRRLAKVARSRDARPAAEAEQEERPEPAHVGAN
jgi:hypothetical protein